MANPLFPNGLQIGIHGLELTANRGEARIAFEPVRLDPRLQVIVPTLVRISRGAIYPIFEMKAVQEEPESPKLTELVAKQIGNICGDAQKDEAITETRGMPFIPKYDMQLDPFNMPDPMNIAFGPVTGYMGRSPRAVHEEIRAHPMVGLITLTNE